MALMTNRKGLPAPLVDAIKHDTYKVGGDISVTTLLDAPQIRILKKKHSFELESDVSEYLWALMGTCVHNILERSHIKDKRKEAFLIVIETIKDEMKNYLIDDQQALQALSDKIFKLMVKFFPEVKSRYIYEMTLQYSYDDKLLYGTFDLYDKEEKCIYDYKVCSVYAYMYPESRRKWNAQVNTYAFMLREQGYEVESAKIVAIFRDFSATKAQLSNTDYPEDQFMQIPIEIVDHEKMRRYIHSRMDLHMKAEGGSVPECTGIDRWSTADEFVVLKKGLKRAIRILSNEEQAKKYILENKHKHDKEIVMDIRPGESKRCQSYCPVREFCPQKKRQDQEHERLAKM